MIINNEIYIFAYKLRKTKWANVILSTLAEKTLSVKETAVLLRVKHSCASQRLTTLKNLGYVKFVASGKNRIFSLTGRKFEDIEKEFLEYLNNKHKKY